MPIFAIYMTHSVESCPLFNADNKKKLKQLSSKKEELKIKYQINILTEVVNKLEHLITIVLEAPDHKAVERYLNDVGYAFYNKIEVQEVEFVDKVIKTL
jgi:hypothetical protein